MIESRATMTEAEWDIYRKHLEKRAYEEQQKIEAEKVRMRLYKESLIEDILKTAGDRFTREELVKKSIRVLERIY